MKEDKCPIHPEVRLIPVTDEEYGLTTNRCARCDIATAPAQPVEELEERLKRIRCDIDQIIVQQIVKPMTQPGRKKSHDETWEVTTLAARAIRELLVKELPSVITREKARYCAEARHEAFYKAHNILYQFAPTGDVTAWDAMKAFEKAQRAIEAEAAEQTKIAEGADEGR